GVTPCIPSANTARLGLIEGKGLPTVETETTTDGGHRLRKSLSLDSRVAHLSLTPRSPGVPSAAPGSGATYHPAGIARKGVGTCPPLCSHTARGLANESSYH